MKNMALFNLTEEEAKKLYSNGRITSNRTNFPIEFGLPSIFPQNAAHLGT